MGDSTITSVIPDAASLAAPVSGTGGASSPPPTMSGPGAAPDAGASAFVPPGRNRPSSFPPPSAQHPSWRRFLEIPAPLRTWLSHAMIYVENTISFLRGLEARDLTPELQQKLRLLGLELERIVEELKSPYLDNGSLSLLGLERIQNMLFQVGHGSILRLNVNMTDANKLDPSGNLGTAYKQAVQEWLQQKFGEVSVTQNPEGTSFLAIDVRMHVIRDHLDRFARDILYRLQQDRTRKHFDFTPQMLEAFHPSATGMVMELSSEGLRVQEILQTRDREEIIRLQERMIGLIEESLRTLAVGSTLAEKCPALISIAGGTAVYSATDLPLIPGTDGYDMLQKYIRLGIGYVPASVYSPKEYEGIEADTSMTRHPRLAHWFGKLDHPKRRGDAGGALQVLLSALDLAAEAGSDAEKSEAVAQMAQAAEALSVALRIGEKARANPRNPLMTKWKQRIHLSDGTRLTDSYFFESLALQRTPKLHLALVELDSFKAFSQAHPIDEVDSHFWRVFDSFFTVAREMGIERPIISQVAGDLVAVAIPTTAISGAAIDVTDFVKRAQAAVVADYRHLPYQDYAKVQVLDQETRGKKIERWPLWKRGEVVFPSQTTPRDSVPFIRTLSVTAVASTINRPAQGEDGVALTQHIDGMARRIEELKAERRLEKGGFALMEAPSQQQGNLAISGFVTRCEGTESAIVASSFGKTVDDQLRAAWGEQWEQLDPQMRRRFLHHLAEEAPSLPPILMPDDVVGIFSRASHGPAALLLPLQPPLIFLPQIRAIR